MIFAYQDGCSPEAPLTSLQAAVAMFGEALEIASADERTHEAFVEIAATRIAHEAATRLELGEAA